MTASCRTARACLILLAAALGGQAAHAQPQPPASPLNASPSVPRTLNKPVLDTATPDFGPDRKPERSGLNVVAEVDGRAITLGEVADAIAELPAAVQALPFNDLFPVVVEQLVRQQALVIEARRQALDEDPVVRRRMQEAEDRVLANELLRTEAARSVTEAALLDRYNREAAGKPGPEDVRLRLIMVSTEAEAAALIREIEGGADFAAVARQSSRDSTAPAGGDLGYMARDGLTPEIGAVAFALPPGQLAPYPVRSGDAWFVIKVEDRRQGPAPPYAAVRSQLVKTLSQEAVPDIVKAALAAATVRRYSIAGKEETRTAGDVAAGMAR